MSESSVTVSEVNMQQGEEGKQGFQNAEKMLEELSEFIFTGKYARFVDDLKRRETWDECVDRVLNMHLKHYNFLSKEDKKKINWAFDLVKAKRVVPSMRSMQFGGKAVEAHNARLYNCFRRDTEFITREGVRSFEDFEHGAQVEVLSHTGQWRHAIVKSYGKQKLNKITVQRKKAEYPIYATPNHRWLLKDGKSSTEIKVGDLLLGAKDIFSEWEYESASFEEKLYWCYGYVYGDGTRVKNEQGEYKYSMVRLCGSEVRYENRFIEMGFKTSSSLSLKGDVMCHTGTYLKTTPDPVEDSPELIRAFVRGYLDADGEKNKNSTQNYITKNLFLTIQTSDEEHANFIRKCFPVAGVYIVSETDLSGQETNFDKRGYTKLFRINNALNNKINSNTPFRVKSIEESTDEEVWCLEVEEDESFVFPFGLVTGNCSVTHIHSIRTFAEVFYLLLAGCGVTIGLNKKFISRLPDLVNADDKTGTVLNYVVEDTIEGWSDSVEALLMCYFKNTAFSGRKIVFDYSKIRKKGSPLKTGGGKAPGHKGLKNAHAKIKKLLDFIIEEKKQARLKTINAYDIVMHTADAVLSGGIRRAATAAIFELDDEEMVNAKTNFKVQKVQKFEKDEVTGEYEGFVTIDGVKHEVSISEWEYGELKKNKTISWIHIEPQRARSNNSVLLRRDNVTKEEFAAVVERTRQWGEPGFVFTDHDEQLLNPCFEVSFIPVTEDGQAGVQFCVAGDTKLLTKQGIETRIDKTVGKEIEIWNGESWEKVKPFKTGDSNELYRVHFNDGSFLDVTDNHRFIVQNSRQSEFHEKTTREIEEEIRKYKKNCKYQLRVPRANISMPENFGYEEVNAYDYGYFIGDGTVGSKSVRRNGCGFAAIYENTFQPSFNGAEISERVYKNYRGTKYKYVKFTNLEKEKCLSLKHEDGLPNFLFSWNETSVMSFIGGWIDADGSKANKGVRLYGAEKKLRDAQLLLTKHNVNSSLNLFQPKGTMTNLCERKNDLYYLRIPDARKILSQKFDLSKGQTPKFKGAFQIIKKVEKLSGKHPTYCVEEGKLHQCVFNNVLTKQCNLSSINGAKIDSLEKYLEAVEAATIIGTLQAGYTEFPYLSKIAKKLTEEEALLGVSMTGVMDNPQVLTNARNQFVAAQFCVKTNKEWAGKIGINQAARTTLLKPEGTSSLVLESASGIHPHHAKRYFRRVQVNKLDPIYKWFKKYNPHMCEESVWSANKTDDVITFPLEVSENAMVKQDLTAIDHLNIIKNTQENWVMTGTTEVNKKPITHNVSCTVIVGNEEEDWAQVVDYLFENRAFFTAVSMLPATGDKDYKQAPLEKATEEDKERWNQLVSNYKSVDYTQFTETEDKTTVQDTIACAGGACEII